MTTEELKKVLSTDAYLPLVKYLKQNLESLKNIDNVKEYSKAQDQAIELKGQKKAYQKLEFILSQIINVHDVPETTPNSGNDYGIDEK